MKSTTKSGKIVQADNSLKFVLLIKREPHVW